MSWEPDPTVDEAPLEKQAYDLVVFTRRVQVDDLLRYADPRWHIGVGGRVAGEVRAYAGRRLLERVEVQWPDGCRNAVKEALYPRIRRLLVALMPMQGKRAADALERRFPVKHQRRRLEAAEWLHRRFLKHPDSAVRVEVMKPIPTMPAHRR